jgi:hypothetical protein
MKKKAYILIIVILSLAIWIGVLYINMEWGETKSNSNTQNNFLSYYQDLIIPISEGIQEIDKYTKYNDYQIEEDTKQIIFFIWFVIWLETNDRLRTFENFLDNKYR